MKTTSKRDKVENQVLSSGARQSQNFFESDQIFQDFLKGTLSAKAWDKVRPLLSHLGTQAAGPMNALSMTADKQGPQLIKRDAWGETINEIRFHPAYWELMHIAVDGGLLSLKWDPANRKAFPGETHQMGFASFYLFAMSELGQDCPLCMTDGAALLLDRYAKDADKDRLLPHIFTDDPKEFYTGGMFMTEKSGGSDVGRNLVSATHLEGDQYLLNGEKWFCSNANGQVIFTLARTQAEVRGTRGLSLFLVEKQLPDGSKNPLEIVRLKEKLGVRSMASAECIFTDTQATLIGEEFEGFKLMADMVNLSRLHNAMASIAAGRRALVEAYQFLSFRETFGKNALQHALIRKKLEELGALHVGQFYFLWRSIQAFDRSLAGDASEGELLRILTPLLKKWTAETAVYLVRESMELMGGMGYIEDTVMPKLMRDVLVLPIWEGAGNIQLLDLLRALHKSDGLWKMEEEILNGPNGAKLTENWQAIREWLSQGAGRSQEDWEIGSEPLYRQLCHMYQWSLLQKAHNEENKPWLAAAMPFWEAQIFPKKSPQASVLSVERVRDLLAWNF